MLTGKMESSQPSAQAQHCPCGQFCRGVGAARRVGGRHGPGVLGGQGETSELISKGPIGLSQVNTGRHHVGEGTRS